MPINAQGFWEPEDDSVAPRVTNLLSSGSGLMTQARQAGFNSANRRGLLNSSVAAGAAQGEAYKVALPIASQEAQQVYGKNIGELQRRADAERQRVDNAAQLERLNRSGEIDTAARDQQGNIQSRLNSEQATAEMQRLQASNAAEMQRLQAQLTNSNEQQAAQIRAEMDRLNASTAADMERLRAAAGFDLERQRDQNAAEMTRLDRQGLINQDQTRLEAGFQREAQERQLAAETQRQQTDLAAQLDRMRVGNALDIDRINVQADRSLQELQLNLAAGDRERAMAAATSMLNSNDGYLAAIMSNPNIDAATRERFIADANARRNAALDVVGQVYDVNLTWGPPAATGTGTGTGTGTTNTGPQPNAQGQYDISQLTYRNGRFYLPDGRQVPNTQVRAAQ